VPNEPGSAVADIEGGRLQLAVTMPCSLVGVAGDVRWPARSDFPHGAALVFAYTATEALYGPEQTPGIEFNLGSEFFTLPPAAAPTYHRQCVELDPVPRSGRISIQLARNGACTPAERIDWHLRIDDLRIVEDASCASD
jgi:hypothetical protein